MYYDYIYLVTSVITLSPPTLPSFQQVPYLVADIEESNILRHEHK